MRQFILFLALFCAYGSVRAARPEFREPYVISENVQPPRSQIITYRNEPSAIAAIADSSTNYVDLNGEWRMKYFARANNIAPNDYDQQTNLEGWGSPVNLPSPWQLSAVGSLLYSAEAYPFLTGKPKIGHYPMPATGGECALYARDITVPFDFMDRKIYLNVGAASGKITLYVNGKKVGFSTDSKNPAEFDISSYVERGQNRVVLHIDRFSGASWVEDQTGWRLSGPNRSIYMLAQPKIRMRDILTRVSLDPTYKNGLLETALLLKTELLNEHQVTVFYDMYDPEGKIVNKATREVTLGMRGEDTVRFTTSIFNVRKWNSETPDLYTIVYRVKREGRFTEYAAAKVGFRTVQIEGNKLLINGVAPLIKGVNFEEFDASTGNVLDKEKVRTELLKMRSMGINAIRTGGYPLPSFFYDLTDEIGFYVVNVANSNTQGLDNDLRSGYSLSNNPAWRNIFVDRAVTAYERTKRNASVVAVALGEDAGNGYSMQQAYLAIKARNAQQIIIYDGSAAEWNTDIYCPLYPTIQRIKDQLGYLGIEQPIIPSRVVFNEQYWKTPFLQGAFIDRWHGLSLDLGATKSAAQIEELDNDYKRTNRLSGTIDISSAQPHIKQIASLFANAEITPVDPSKGVVRIKNNLQYADLSSFSVRYRVMTNGNAGKWQNAAVSCAAKDEVEVIMGAFGGNKSLEVEIGNIYWTTVR